jgi:hypothetical protein
MILDFKIVHVYSWRLPTYLLRFVFNLIIAFSELKNHIKVTYSIYYYNNNLDHWYVIESKRLLIVNTEWRYYILNLFVVGRMLQDNLPFAFYR